MDTGSGAVNAAAVNAMSDSERDDPAIIERDIEATRAEMGETLDAIQNRLDPEVVSEQAKDVARYASEEAKEVVKFAIDEAKGAVRELADQATSSVRDATIGKAEKMMAQARGSTRERGLGNGLIETITQNPIPAAMAAIGIGWLWRSRQSSSAAGQYGGSYRQGVTPGSSTYGYSDYSGSGYTGGHEGSGYGWRNSGSGASHEEGSVGQQARQVANQVQERAGDVVGQMQQHVGHAQHGAQGLWQKTESNVIAMGSVGLLLGGLAALLIPETEKERELLGEHRDEVIGNIQDVATNTVKKVQRVAGEAVQEAIQTTKNEAQAEGLLSQERDASGRSALA